ncbi:MAG: sugar ABC transporter substrate-binding protein [Chloroflexi bacterium]|nr:sugar ABC transporter substrate-binding protein [Chloroflexota bacterium]
MEATEQDIPQGGLAAKSQNGNTPATPTDGSGQTGRADHTGGMLRYTRRRLVRAGIAAGLGAGIGAAALAACRPLGARQTSDLTAGREVARLRLWHWDSFWIDALTRTTDEFVLKHPRLRVDVEVTNKAEYVDKLVAQVAGGSAPDTIGVSVTGDFNVIQAKGMTVPLDTLLKRDRYYLGDFFDVNLRQHQWGGKQIGLPYGWTMIVWFFNQDLFQRQGVKTPYEHWKAGTWTWDTYLDLARRFKRLGQDHFGTAGLPVPNNSMSFPLIWSNDGDVFDAQYETSLLDRPPAMETYDFMYQASRLAPVGEQAKVSTPEAGKVAMWFQWEPWYMLNTEKIGFKYGIAPPPAAPQTKRSVFIGNAPGFSVANGTRYPDEAWALLKHMISPEAMRRYFLEANISPLRKSQSTSSRFWDSHLGLPDPGLMAEIAAARNASARIPPRVSNFSELQEVLKEEFNAAWADHQSVRDAAHKSAQRATALLTEAEIDR